MGVATTRYHERSLAAAGLGGNAQPQFGAHDAVCGAGVLFLLPALLAQGLLKTNEVYTVAANHYYGLESVVLTLAFMALARIKNPEQIKQCRPGEIGKIIGLDRSPEVRCLRDKINLLSSQKQAQKLNRLLIGLWYEQPSEESSFLYIDGHVRVYHGYKANLPAKFVSRQKLCLNATTEYWVNDMAGMPVMMVTGELTEKLQQVIEDLIIPELKKTKLLPAVELQQTQTNTTESIATDDPPPQQEGENAEQAERQSPTCTLIFDREGYDIPFFKRLWQTHRIAILSYRKNVHDTWPEESFKPMDITVLEHVITMRICEQKVTLGGMVLREIRRLTDNGHQTSIITNNGVIDMKVAAGRMFGRWSQENFFRYMIADYDFDKMIEYGVQSIDEKKEVVNPQYRKFSHQLKKQKEKTARLEATLLEVIEQAIVLEDAIDKLPKVRLKEADLIEKINAARLLEQNIRKQKEAVTARITLKDMPDQTRYNQLKPESKMLMNIIKMICYRAETSVANLIAEFSNDRTENRMLVKQIIQNNADIHPDQENKTLTISLHSLSAPRFNRAAQKLAELLNQSETIFPGSDWQLIFKTAAS